ncbi:glycosyltransferase [Isoptericola sp. NEAU-Y5]|uniref:Glycosyltransferase n=1 Tax=Isoptericola luteus TaxID=2879484 RepID=A0ABS7ZB01_9MICO|nr:glycosyltransferase [Isoptericola sp. NEAU-Y5]MCA5892231.1 glycosyltransferase [Isoptericola sp. NEAU-Y5]
MSGPGPGGGRARDLGDGPLGRFTGAVYAYLVVGVLLALGHVPSLVLLALLDRSSGNALLVPLCLLPAVPFWCAALFALHARTTPGARTSGGSSSAAPSSSGPAPADLAPARSFGRGLRLGARDGLALAAPDLLLVGVVTTSVVHREAAGISALYAGLLVGIGVVVLLWLMEALLLASVFSFRVRDVARLALYHLSRRPLVTLGLLALLVVAAGVVWAAGELVLALFAVVGAWFWLRLGRPVLDDVRRRFVAEPPLA